MIDRLFPATVRWATGTIGAELPLHPDEERLAREMGPVRRREFAAGRACAHRALAALGDVDGPVLRGARRMPCWPEGVVGSITHTGTFCAAAVARASRFAGIGLDAERARPLSARAMARICSPDEIAALPGAPAERESWAAVVFSAKESLYKAYFPLTGVFIGFRDAQVSLQPEGSDAGRFSARLVRSQAPDAAGRRGFEGRYGLDGGRILTGLAVPL